MIKLLKNLKIKIDKVEVPSVTTKSGNVTTPGDLYLLTSPISMNSFGLDGYGNVRWMLNDTYYHNIKVLDNGHLLIGIDTDSTSGLPTVIREIDYLGRIYNEYTIDSGYLNDFFVKSNGNIIVTSKNADRITISDLVLEIDKNTGKIVKQIDVYKLFESIDKSFTDGIERDDYFYNSGIEYYEDTDTLLLTYWGGEMVVSIDYSDSKINWIFTNPDNLPSTFDSYLLKGDDGFVYPKAMHQAKLSGDTLKVLDNGYSTIKNETDLSNLKGSYSSVNTYTITDKKNSTC
ncbi:MAG: aryl-sulfate sulfotransferase [Clostridium sp.]|nr:MAG: aryl-sulfate sulfotransferase [Clostridium sp.]